MGRRPGASFGPVGPGLSGPRRRRRRCRRPTSASWILEGSTENYYRHCQCIPHKQYKSDPAY